MTYSHRLIVAAVLLVAGAAFAEDVGTVAAARGTATIGRAGTQTPATVGMTVELGDELHTGADGQLRVLFRDDSVVDLAENATLVVDQQVFDPGASRFTSLMRLVQGKARALVGSYYKAAGASYEIETPTAVAGVRGTSFMVAYDPDSDATEVIGIHGQIQVRNLAERVAGTVYISAEEATTVLRDEPPTAPEQMDEQRFHREVEGLEILALGAFANPATQPLRAGANVPPPDRAPSASGQIGQLGRDQLRNAGDVAGQPLSVVGGDRGALGVPF